MPHERPARRPDGTLPRPRHRVFAAVYDRMLKTNENVIAPFCEFAVGGARGRVVEIGAGTGHNLQHYDWANVESVDVTEPDPFMFRRAEARAAALDRTTRAQVRLRGLDPD